MEGEGTEEESAVFACYFFIVCDIQISAVIIGRRVKQSAKLRAGWEAKWRILSKLTVLIVGRVEAAAKRGDWGQIMGLPG